MGTDDLDPIATSLRSAVTAAAPRRDVREAVENVYRALQDRIDLRRPVCVTSGRCCRFDEFGHSLFVTTMELAAFVAGLDQPQATHNPGGCPFQRNRLCTVHARRPFGCRVFFCDASSSQWQQEQYEFFHREIRRLHGALEVPYFYVEWRRALTALAGGKDRFDRIEPPVIHYTPEGMPAAPDARQPGVTPMRKFALLGLLGLTLTVTGCARPFEIGWTPAYSARERNQQIARNWDYEGKQLMDDLDSALLLRPASRMTIWNVR